jgi:hypothetical protein
MSARECSQGREVPLDSWSSLYTRFKKLAEITGAEKSSSYVMNVVFGPTEDEEILIELGTYDIPYHQNHITLGPFKTEAEAFKDTEEQIAAFEIAVKEAFGEIKRKQNPAESAKADPEIPQGCQDQRGQIPDR